MDTEIVLGKRLSLPIEVFLATTAFVVPFLIGGPQLLVGTVVNAFLFIAAGKNISKIGLILLITLPSIAAFSRGLVFGPLTYFLLYFIPFIWLGNTVLIISFNNRLTENFPSVLRILLAASAKTAFLFLTANLVFQLHLVPKFFLTSMGLFQFITAVFGGIIALTIQNLEFKIKN